MRIIELTTSPMKHLIAAAANDDDPDVVRYTVDVLDRWKGTVPAHLVIVSENSSGRFPMEIGKSYVVFLQRSGHDWVVDNCGNSGSLEQSTALMQALGERLR